MPALRAGEGEEAVAVRPSVAAPAESAAWREEKIMRRVEILSWKSPPRALGDRPVIKTGTLLQFVGCGEDVHAVVEFDDGTVTSYDLIQIRFIKE
jgi:hypothetical protein